MRDCFTPGDAKLHLTQARFVLPNFIETGMNISAKNCFYKYKVIINWDCVLSMHRNMIVTYIFHSGYAVTFDDFSVIIDYHSDVINPDYGDYCVKDHLLNKKEDLS
jgi:hypothetical protein